MIVQQYDNIIVRLYVCAFVFLFSLPASNVSQANRLKRSVELQLE